MKFVRLTVFCLSGAVLGFLAGTAFFWCSNVHYTRPTIVVFAVGGILAAGIKNKKIAKAITFPVIGAILFGLINLGSLFALEKTDYPKIFPPLVNFAGALAGFFIAVKRK
jgi:peptidoglycan/LPS O-acetylase OafA/YrhL